MQTRTWQESQALMDEAKLRKKIEEEEYQSYFAKNRQQGQQSGQVAPSQQGGMNPQQMMDMYNKYKQFKGNNPKSGSTMGSPASYMGASGSAGAIPAGSTFGGVGAGGASAFMPTAGANTFAFGGGSAGASSPLYSNPYGWIALAIMANEKSALNGGHRDNGSQYWRDLIDGRVIGQDTKERWNPKIDKWTDGKWSSSGLGGDMQFGADMSGIGGWSNAGSSWKNTTVGKALKSLF